MDFFTPPKQKIIAFKDDELYLLLHQKGAQNRQNGAYRR